MRPRHDTKNIMLNNQPAPIVLLRLKSPRWSFTVFVERAWIPALVIIGTALIIFANGIQP